MPSAEVHRTCVQERVSGGLPPCTADSVHNLAAIVGQTARDKVRGTALVPGVPHSVVALEQCCRLVACRGTLLLLHLHVRQLLDIRESELSSTCTLHWSVGWPLLSRALDESAPGGAGTPVSTVLESWPRTGMLTHVVVLCPLG